MRDQIPNRASLIEAIQTYGSQYTEELAFRQAFLDLLCHPRAFYRDHLPGHITASSWIIDPTGQHCLLTHHAKLHRWLQPGGHADGEENVVAVALREAQEETGLRTLQLVIPHIFDLDIHPIPARADFPEHHHYDIRFLFKASMDEPLTITEESKDLAWFHHESIARETANNVSILRMAEKVKALSIVN